MRSGFNTFGPYFRNRFSQGIYKVNILKRDSGKVMFIGILNAPAAGIDYLPPSTIATVDRIHYN
jgi:hypothetical protein